MNPDLGLKMGMSPVVGRYLEEHPDADLDDLKGTLELLGPSPCDGWPRLRVRDRLFDLPHEHRREIGLMVGREVHAVVPQVSGSKSVLLSIHPTDHSTRDCVDEVGSGPPVDHSLFSRAFDSVHDAVLRLGPIRQCWPADARSANADGVALFSAPALALRELLARGRVPAADLATLSVLLGETARVAEDEAARIRAVEDEARRIAPVYIMDSSFTLHEIYELAAAEYRSTQALLGSGGSVTED